MHDLYKGFKKVAEDDTSAVLEHEQGHRITLAKSGLGKKQKKALKNLSLHQAEGTQIPEEEQDAGNILKQIGAQITDAVAKKVVEGAEESVITPQQIEQMPEPTATDIETGQPVYKGVGAPTIEERYLEALGPQKPVVGPLDVIKAGLKPGGASQTYSQLQKGLEQKQVAQEQQKQLQEAQKSGLVQGPQPLKTPSPGLVSEQKTPAEITQAQTELALAPARPMRVAVPMTPEQVIGSSKTTASQKMMAYNQLVMRTVQERKQAREEYLKQIKDRRIEPKRIYGEDTGKNILTAISLLLGGMAGGVLRQENPALRLINEEIERDLRRQKDNMAIEDNLYKDNLNMLGDEAAAYTQSMNQMRQIALMQMEEMMGRAYDPSNPMMALNMQAEAAKLRSQIDAADAAQAERIQQQKILQALNNSEGVSKMDPGALAQILVKDNGDRAKIYEEIKDRQTIASAMPEVLKLFEQAKDENQAFYGILPKPTTFPLPFYGQLKKPDSVKALETLLTPLIKTQGPAREPEMRRIFDTIVPAPFDTEDDQVLKRNALKQFISTLSAAPVSKAYGLDLDRFASTQYTAPEDLQRQQFLDYAQKNINSSDATKKARAQKILELYGR